jgi:hypothetical protein
VATTQGTEAHPIPISPGDWRVVSARSELGFPTRIAFGLIPVRGRYSGFDGELHIDAAGNASGVLRIEAETISTGIKKRDSHLRSSDFFAVERHPHMTFELTGLTPQCRWCRDADRNAAHSRPGACDQYARLPGRGGLGRAGHRRRIRGGPPRRRL